MFKINKIDVRRVEKYLQDNSDKSIQEVYDFIKKIKVRYRTTEQHLVYNYLWFNRKKLGIK